MYKFASLVVVLVISVSQCRSANDEDCKNSVKAIMNKQAESFKACLGEMKFANKEEQKAKTMCILKCAMTKEGYLAEDGHFELTKSLGILSDFSNDIQTKIVDHLMQHCEPLIHQIDPKEETCTSYEPVITCCHKMSMQVCKIPDK